jgi:hypothetical protein
MSRKYNDKKKLTQRGKSAMFVVNSVQSLGVSKKEANRLFDIKFKKRFTSDGKLRPGMKMPNKQEIKGQSNEIVGYPVSKRGGGIKKKIFNKTRYDNLKNGGKSMYDILYDTDPEVRLPANRYKTQDDVSVKTLVSPLDNISQVPNTRIDVLMDVDALTAAAACWPLYCMHNRIGVNEVINIPGTGNVGKLWFFAATLAYDLWVATSNNWSIFSKFPEVYADLRAAIMETNIPGYQYKFVTPNNFFGPGGMYPLGYPLSTDNVSLSWIASAVGAQFPMFNTTPTLTIDQIQEFGPDNATELWTKVIESRESKHKWVTAGESNVYMGRTEAFAMVRLANDDPNNNRWCNFQLETKMRLGCRWLAYMGFADQNPNLARAGSFIVANYQTAANYCHRIVNGISGITPNDVIIRMQYIDIETVIQNFLTSLFVADLNYNNVAGERSINQAMLTRSVLASIEAGQFLHAALTVVLQKFFLLNFVGFDNPVTNSFVLAGAQYIVGINDITNRIFSWLAESFSGLQRLETRVTPQTTFVEYPCLVCYGTFASQGYSPMNTQDNLLPLAEKVMPGMGTIAYSFKIPAISGLTASIDPANNLVSFTEGDAMPDAMEILANQMGAVQGNMSTAVGGNRVHSRSTFMYLTRMLLAQQQLKPRWLNKELTKIIYKDKVVEVNVTPVSPIYTAIVSELRSRYDFNSDNITWVITRQLPSSFLNPSDYASIYNAKISSPTELGTTEAYGDVYVKSIVAQGHSIAGNGDELVMGDNNRMEWGVGGGFLTGIGSFLDGIIGF